jgi:hypothetical protein
MTDNERKPGPFEQTLRAHDWYYAYSDDHGVWLRGQASVKALQARHEALKCPFTLLELNLWVHNMILEDFEEVEPGKFWRKSKSRQYVAACRNEDLIPQAKADEITAWMREHDVWDEIVAQENDK